MGISLESATEYNLSHGTEEEQPTDPQVGNLFIVTEPKEKRKTEVCYESGIWESISPLSINERGILLYNGKVLTPIIEELPLSGNITTTYTELAGTVGKAGRLKTLYILRSDSTEAEVYITLRDKDDNILVPEITMKLSSVSSGTYNFTDRIGAIVKKATTDKIMIRGNGTNTSVATGTLFATGYIQTEVTE